MSLAAALTVLAEAQHVRLLRVLAHEELGVGELVRVVGWPQSTVSRHLKALVVAGWVARRTVGTTALVRMAPEALSPEALALWAIIRDDPEAATETAADRDRIALVIAERAADAGTFFGRVASGWDALRDQLFGRAFVVPAALALVPPDATIADLGCGTGELLARIAPFCERLFGIDREPSMVAAAAQRVVAESHVQVLEGPLEALPLGDASVDLALMVLVLHHLAEPSAALHEAARILRPGGRLVVVDMQPHTNRAWSVFGHLHQGFAPADLDALVGPALSRERHVALPNDPDTQGPPLFVASFTRSTGKETPALQSARRGSIRPSETTDGPSTRPSRTAQKPRSKR